MADPPTATMIRFAPPRTAARISSPVPRLVAARDPRAVRLVTTRNNQLLFRTAWSILKHRADAEDAVQSAYLKAVAAIGGFEGHSALSTWLTRIVINEALGRKRAAQRRNEGQTEPAPPEAPPPPKP